MTDAGIPVTPPGEPESTHQGGFDLGGPPQAGKHYRVLARKYRPSSFDDLIGQDAVVRTVSNAFETGRIPQAWILTGVRGVGKTTTARILARALNYELADGSVKGPTIHMPVLGVHCQAIMESRHMDVLEMDAASHTGVDDVRQINDSVRYAPASARYKVYIIDEVHMLSTAAFNAFLKTLEEPPEHAKFVFATTEIRKVPVTVLSRCQRFDLRRVDADVLMGHLANIAAKENVDAEPEALGIIARAAEGSVRDSLSLFDQAIAHAAGPVRADAVRQMLGLADRTRVIDLFDSLARGDIASAFAEFRDQYDTGADPIVVLSDLAEFVNFVTRVKIVPATADNVAFGETERLRARDFASKLSMRVLSRMWQMLLKGITEVQAATRPAAAAEMVLVRIAYVADMPTPDEAIRMLDQNGGAASASSAASATPRSAPASTRRQSMSSCGRARASSATARQRRGVRAPADERAGVRCAVRTGRAENCHLPGTGGAGRREARPADKGRARSRCPAGPHRGRPARGGAGAQRGTHPDQRSVAKAGAMDRAALDRDRVQRAGSADAAFAKRSAEKSARARRRIRSAGAGGAGAIPRRQSGRGTQACPGAAGIRFWRRRPRRKFRQRRSLDKSEGNIHG